MMKLWGTKETLFNSDAMRLGSDTLHLSDMFQINYTSDTVISGEDSYVTTTNGCYIYR